MDLKNIPAKINLAVSHSAIGNSKECIRNFKDLPDKAKNYIKAIEDFIDAKISSISTSPEREDTILLENPFK